MVDEGTLTGAGEVDVTGSFSSVGGAEEGSGSTVVESGASGVFGRGGSELVGRTLVNDGSMVMLEGALIVGKSSASIVNDGVFTVEGQDTSLYVEGSEAGHLPKFVNAGTFRKAEGPGATSVGFAFANEGAVSAAGGALEFTGGGVPGAGGGGSWSASGTGEVVFGGGEFSLGGRVSMSGAIVVTGVSYQDYAVVDVGQVEGSADLKVTQSGHGGVLSVGGASASSVSDLVVDEGTLTGAGEVDVTGSFSSVGGAEEGSGSTVVESGASGVFGRGGSELVGRTLVNDGSMVMLEGALIVGKSSASIVNDGVFTVEGQDTSLYVEGSEAGHLPKFVNAGTFRKAEGPGATSVGFAFANEGAVSAAGGALEFTGGGMPDQKSYGSWLASGGAARIVFGGGEFMLGPDVALSGSIVVTRTEFTPTVVTAGGITGTPNLAITSSAAEDQWNYPAEVKIAASFDVENLEVDAGVLEVEGDVYVSSGFAWRCGGVMAGSGATVLERGVDGEVGPCQDSTVLSGRSLVNDGYLKWSGGISGRNGASILNDGTVDALGFFSAPAELEAEPELSVPAFSNAGTFETNGGPVSSDWEFQDYPGPIECAVCDILYPDTDPPSGICSVATSENVVFYPRPGAPFPPAVTPPPLEGWWCEDD